MRSLPHTRALLLLASLSLLPLATPVLAQTDATVVYLVRHAERAEDGTNDPPISVEGQARSELLAELLSDARLTAIHTTDFKRTRETGAPAAEAAGLSMTEYDPRSLPQLVDHLWTTRGRHLVLGHSNTTPQLVEALGGDAHGTIEEMEYDRLYIVTLTEAGASTVLIRFGQRYEG